MAILKAEAIVLRGWRFGETSKILSVYTRDYGKVKLVAKGARDPKSKFKGCLEPLTHIQIVYYDKRTRELQLLSQTDLLDPHLHIIGDMERTSLALSSAELVDKAVIGEEPFPQVFDLLAQTIRCMDSAQGYLEGLLWYFESRFIDLMGYKPKWDACLKCGESLGTGGGFFLPGSGGLECSRCGSSQGGLVVGGETLEILYWLQSGNIGEVPGLQPTPANRAEIRKMFDLYFRTHIEQMKGLRALKFYYDLFENR